jgi:hypothetical protein
MECSLAGPPTRLSGGASRPYTVADWGVSP